MRSERSLLSVVLTLGALACGAPAAPIATAPVAAAAPADESARQARERQREANDRAEHDRVAGSPTTMDASNGETLLAFLVSPDAERRHDALERCLRSPDMLPRRPDAVAAVLAMVDDYAVMHSPKCKADLAASDVADGVRFAQAECAASETITYAHGALDLLRAVGGIDAASAEWIEDAIVTYALTHPERLDVITRAVHGDRVALGDAVLHRRVLIQRLAAATRDSERVVLLRLMLGARGAAFDEDRGTRWDVVAGLLDATSLEVRATAGLVLLHPAAEPGTESIALRGRAVASVEAALADPRAANVVEGYLAGSSLDVDELRVALVKRARGGSANALRVLARGAPKTVDELRTLVDILRDPGRAADHESVLDILARARRDQAAAARLAVLTALHSAPPLVESAARALDQVALTEAELGELLAAYRLRCQAPRRHVLERSPPDCRSAHELLSNTPLRARLSP